MNDNTTNPEQFSLVKKVGKHKKPIMTDREVNCKQVAEFLTKQDRMKRINNTKYIVEPTST